MGGAEKKSKREKAGEGAAFLSSQFLLPFTLLPYPFRRLSTRAIVRLNSAQYPILDLTPLFLGLLLSSPFLLIAGGKYDSQLLALSLLP